MTKFPEVYLIPGITTRYAVEVRGSVYIFPAARWDQKRQIKAASNAVRRQWFRETNRCRFENYPEKVLEQIVFGCRVEEVHEGA